MSHDGSKRPTEEALSRIIEDEKESCVDDHVEHHNVIPFCGVLVFMAVAIAALSAGSLILFWLSFIFSIVTKEYVIRHQYPGNKMSLNLFGVDVGIFVMGLLISIW